MKFAYVVVCWYGQRRFGVGRTGLYYIEKHLDILSRRGIDGVMLPIFLINSESSTKDKDISDTKEAIDKYRPFDVEPIVIYRDNKNWSYGAWHDAIIWLLINRPDIKYAMLLEDDYLPARYDFANIFIELLKSTNAAYACQLIARGKDRILPAIANGMIDLEKARKLYDEYKRVFILSDDEPNNTSQKVFLNLILTKYPILGLNNYTHPFSADIHTNVNGVEIVKKQTLMYGGKDGILVRPIE